MDTDAKAKTMEEWQDIGRTSSDTDTNGSNSSKASDTTGVTGSGTTTNTVTTDNSNVYQPYIKEMKLIDKIRTKWGYRYKFSTNLEAKSKFSQCDLEIGKPKEFRERVFLDKKQAEKEIERRLKGSLI